MKRRAWAGAFVGVAAMVVTSVASVAAPAAAAPPPAAGACVVSAADQAIDQVEFDLYTLINNYRVQNGRAWLPLHTDMTRAAAWFARDMATKNYFPANHVDSNNRDVSSRFTWCGNTYTSWAENIAANTTTVNQAQTIFDQWRNSPPHNDNMLSTNVTTMGLAKAFDASSMYDYYYVNTFSNEEPLGVADFNDDGKTDRTVFRPSTGQWFVQGGSPEATGWGTNGDVPVPGDYNGDGFADKAVYRPSNGVWYIQNASPIAASTGWGTTGDIPVPADYDGDGDTDIAVFRPSNGVWYMKGAFGVAESIGWGTNGDIPVPADYDGDGKDDIAVFRPSNGVWYVRNGITVGWGTNGDIPVPADYNGDGSADVAVFRPSNGVWYRRNVAPDTVGWGTAGTCCADVPVPGDYNWDGIADTAVYRKATGQWFVQNGSPGTVGWGTTGDLPVVLPPALRLLVGLSA